MNINNNPYKPAVFLDRDGVIIHNRANYVRSWEDVKIYPYAVDAIKKLNQLGFFVFIITNQSPIGRGILSETQVIEINNYLLNFLEKHGARINRTYFCPHAPETHCACRKPQPGMILQARNEFPINFNLSWVIGDAISDIQAGINAGITQNVLLLTGRGKKQLNKKPQTLPCFIEKNLHTAVKTIANTK